jgi:hypothetical protein
LDDLDRLPVLHGIKIASPPLSPTSNPGKAVTEGHRNDNLWRHCMRSARSCDDFDSLLDVARTRNAEIYAAAVRRRGGEDCQISLAENPNRRQLVW